MRTTPCLDSNLKANDKKTKGSPETPEFGAIAVAILEEECFKNDEDEPDENRDVQNERALKRLLNEDLDWKSKRLLASFPGHQKPDHRKTFGYRQTDLRAMGLADTHAPSSPAQGFSTVEEELAYYKSQYEHLEGELHEFQASSRELEAELERDVEASEKREQKLKDQVESLKYEVDEWKAKHKQSKQEANSAQNTLQKEITTLRDANRTIALKLRDTEVANDDFERQTRNTTMSLEDTESKYNQTLERGVMLEEEIKIGEQERENLRIETQRLRDELSDLKVEAEITQEKLRNLENANTRRLKRKSASTDSKSQGPRSPASEKSLTSNASTPPVPKSETSASDAPTPPSPPLSETSANAKVNGAAKTPVAKATRATDSNTTPRQGHYTLRRPRHTRGPSLLPNSATTPSFMRATASSSRTPRPSGVSQEPLPRSGSLYQIRGLIGKMQKLEERVQSARSKLPAPTHTPPNTSPRGSTLVGTAHIPATVTIRSNRKRPSVASGATVTPTRSAEDGSRMASHGRSRLSYGGSTPGDSSRPSSRASNTSHSSAHQFARPSSRASMSGARSMGDPYSQYSAAASRRPRSSIAGDFNHVHGSSHSQAASSIDEADDSFSTPTNRRTTLDRTGIPTPSGKSKRPSGVGFGHSTMAATPTRRRSQFPVHQASADGRPGSRGQGQGQDADAGETF